MVFRQNIFLTVLSLWGSFLGFLTQVSIARIFGTSPSVDGLYFSIALPAFLGGIFSAAANLYLTPLLRRAALQGGLGDSLGISRARFFLLLLLLIATCAFLGVLHKYVLPEQSLILGVPELQYMLWAAWLFGLVMIALSIISAALLAMLKPISAAIAQMAPALGGLIVLTLLHSELDTLSVIVGQVVFGALSVFFYYPLVRKTITAALPSLAKSLKTDRAAAFRHSALAMLCFGAYPIIDSILAPRAGEGVMAELAYSQRIIIGLGTTVIAAPYAILASRFADVAREGSKEEFKQLLLKNIILYGCIVLTLMVIIIGSAGFIASLLLPEEKGASLALCIQIMSPGMVMMLIAAILFRACAALEAGYASLAPVGLLWVFSYSGLGWLMLDKGATGLAMAYTTTWAVCILMAGLITAKCAKNHYFRP